MQTIQKRPVFPNDVHCHFDISTIESVDLKPGNTPIRRPHYQIVWISQGSGHFSIDLEKFRIRDNTTYTIPPGRYHQFMAEGRLSGYVLSFNMDFLHLALESPGRPFFTEITSDLNRVKMYLLKREDQALQDVLADISVLEDRSRFIAVMQGGIVKAGQLTWLAGTVEALSSESKALK